MTSTKLTFHADDLGSHPDVDAGILQLTGRDILGAVSVLVTGKTFSSELVHRSELQRTSLGIHLALTDTKPLTTALPPSWLDSDGSFIRHWKNLRSRLLTGVPPLAAVYQEWRAQIEALQSVADHIVFIDSHQNLHLLPHFSGVVKALQREFEIPFVRVFYDPPQRRKPIFTLCAALARFGYRSVPKLPTYGMYESGDLTFDGLRRGLLAAKSRHSAFAFVTHPGCPVQSQHGSLHYELNWQQEFDLLVSPEVQDLLSELDIALSNLDWLTG